MGQTCSLIYTSAERHYHIWSLRRPDEYTLTVWSLLSPEGSISSYVPVHPLTVSVSWFSVRSGKCPVGFSELLFLKMAPRERKCGGECGEPDSQTAEAP